MNAVLMGSDYILSVSEGTSRGLNASQSVNIKICIIIYFLFTWMPIISNQVMVSLTISNMMTAPPKISNLMMVYPSP